MKIKEMKINGKEVESARWNSVYVYRKAAAPSGFPNEYVWEYNAATGAFPNTVDNTEYFDFTRNLVHYSSSKKTKEYLYEDKTPGDDGYIYAILTSGQYAQGKMYFTMTVPAHTTIQVEGLLKGYDNIIGNDYTSKLYITETKPTKTSVSTTEFTNAALVLYDEINAERSSYSGNYRSDAFDTRVGTFANDTDEDKTYYVVFFHAHPSDVSNYMCGLFVKYLKFIKI